MIADVKYSEYNAVAICHAWTRHTRRICICTMQRGIVAGSSNIDKFSLMFSYKTFMRKILFMILLHCTHIVESQIFERIDQSIFFLINI